MKNKVVLGTDLVFLVCSCIVCSFLKLCSPSEVSNTETFYAYKNSKSLLMKYTSSRTVASKIIFQGVLLNFNKTMNVDMVAARFKFQILLKGELGRVERRPKLIWIASPRTTGQYDCFKDLNRSSSYVVYLNGSFTDVPIGFGYNADKFGQPMVEPSIRVEAMRRVYWIEAQPQTATKKRLAEVKKYSCMDCVGKPEVVLKRSSRSHQGQTDVTLKCHLTADCKLVSLFFWFKDDRLLTDKGERQLGQFLIRNESYSSQLEIRDFLIPLDNGQYHCLVVNVIGRRNSSREILPTPGISSTIRSRPSGPMPTKKPTFVPCTDKTICGNYGDCYQNTKLGNDFYCKCYEGYTGKTCRELSSANKDVVRWWDWAYGSFVMVSKAGLNIIIAVSVFVFFLLFAVIVIITCCFLRLKRDLKKLKAERLKYIEEASRSAATVPKEEGKYVDSSTLSKEILSKEELSSHLSCTAKDSKNTKEKDFLLDDIDHGGPRPGATTPSTTVGSWRVKDSGSSQPSPIFSSMRRNYQNLDNPKTNKKEDKPIQMSPIIGRRGGGDYRPLGGTLGSEDTPKQQKVSSTFTHYVIGSPHETKSRKGAQFGGPQEPPSEAVPVVGNESPPSEKKIEDDINGILKELGDYVNENQQKKSNSKPPRPLR